MHKFLILLEIIVDAKPHFFLLIKIKQAIHVNINYQEILYSPQKKEGNTCK